MKWALVLSGGGARGLAHIGVLEALEYLRKSRDINIPPPSLIVGCSMGAIVGALYAGGMTPGEMKSFLGKDFDVTNYLSGPEKPAPWGFINKAFKIGRSIHNAFAANGLDSGDRLQELLEELTSNRHIGQTDIPFFCNATDLKTGEEVVLEEGPLATAVRASASFPGVFSPVPHSGRLLADGFLVHNTPVWVARRKGCSRVLAVYLDDFYDSPRMEPENLPDVILRAFDCAVRGRELTRKDIPTASILASNGRSPFDFDRPLEQIAFGYEAAMAQKGTIRTFFAKGPRGAIGRIALGREQRKEHTRDRS